MKGNKGRIVDWSLDRGDEKAITWWILGLSKFIGKAFPGKVSEHICLFPLHE